MILREVYKSISSMQNESKLKLSLTILLPKIKFAHNTSTFIHMFRGWKSFIFRNKIQPPIGKKEVPRNVKVLPNTFVGMIFQVLGFIENLINPDNIV